MSIPTQSRDAKEKTDKSPRKTSTEKCQYGSHSPEKHMI